MTFHGDFMADLVCLNEALDRAHAYPYSPPPTLEAVAAWAQNKSDRKQKKAKRRKVAKARKAAR